MKLSPSIKTNLIYTAALVHIILFLYAAVSKIIDFQNFQVQLGQSPLLSAYAGFVSYSVPVVELIIVVLLFFSASRQIGLYASLLLMVMFTTYIFIMLHFSPFVPCSCGGILEKLSWNEHLLFNAIVLVVSLLALLLFDNPKKGLLSKKIALPSGIILSIVTVIVLFLSSENTIHHRNNFTRRFPHHPAENLSKLNITFDSYYIAGYANGKIYLGNTTAPLVVTVVDTNSKNKKEFIIQLKKNNFPFTSPRLVIQYPNFYFIDGTVPCVFKGNVFTWKPTLVMYKQAYFSSFVPIDNNKAAIKATGSRTHENVLGLLNHGQDVQLNYKILQKQIDGIFDTDGMLLYNHELHKVIHTYYYRNQFIIADTNLKNLTTGKTIDTISKAQLKIATINSKKITTLASQPLLVNRKTATYGNYLFVNSALIGKFEPTEMWQKAAIIDVYNLTKNTYDFSFYIYNEGESKVKDFIIANDLVISLSGKYLIIDKIKTPYYKNWLKTINSNQ